jgi:hypothetical protein
MKLPLQTIFLLLGVAALALLADAWRTARHDSQQLAATLAAQNAIVQQTGEQEKQRDSQLASALAAIQAEKRAIRTPEQAAQKLPEALPPLPLPITIHIPALSTKSPASFIKTPGSTAQPPDSPVEKPLAEDTETSLSIPRPDLIPLYDQLQDCRASQVQATALQKDVTDEKARSAALLQERNAALTAAHGGSLLQRLKRSTKWFVIGLATGAAVAAAVRH